MEREASPQWRDDAEQGRNRHDGLRLPDDLLPVLSEEEEAAADGRALDDIAAGRVYPHEVVREWLKTWGQPGRLAFKEWFASRDG